MTDIVILRHDRQSLIVPYHISPGGRGRQISMGQRSAWSTQQVLSHPELQETLSQSTLTHRFKTHTHTHSTICGHLRKKYSAFKEPLRITRN